MAVETQHFFISHLHPDGGTATSLTPEFKILKGHTESAMKAVIA
jgi:hypothetical protein